MLSKYKSFQLAAHTCFYSLSLVAPVRVRRPAWNAPQDHRWCGRRTSLSRPWRTLGVLTCGWTDAELVRRTSGATCRPGPASPLGALVGARWGLEGDSSITYGVPLAFVSHLEGKWAHTGSVVPNKKTSRMVCPPPAPPARPPRTPGRCPVGRVLPEPARPPPAAQTEPASRLGRGAACAERAAGCGAPGTLAGNWRGLSRARLPSHLWG